MKPKILVLALAAMAALAPSALAQGQAATTAAGTIATGNGVAPSAATATAYNAALASGTQFDAVLKTNLDSQDAKVGDRVTAEVTNAVQQDGAVVLPKGSKLFGHVTQVSAADDPDSSASISVLFEQAITPQGWSLPVHAVITGIAGEAGVDGSAAATAMQPMPQPRGMVRGGSILPGGVVAGAAEAAGATAGAPRSADGPAAGNPLPASNGAAGVGSPSAGLTSRHGNLSFASGSHVQLQEQAPGASH